MWARVLELALGCWLAMSPFLFNGQEHVTFHRVNSPACAVAVVAFALVSFRESLRRMHLLQATVGVWLIGCALWMAGASPAPILQNYIVTGLLLLMLAVVPSRSAEPPEGWGRFYRSFPDKESSHSDRGHPDSHASQTRPDS